MSNSKSKQSKSIGIYEAKSQLSKLIRAVKQHKVTFQISERGKPVALLSPLPESTTLNERIEELMQSGIIAKPTNPDARIKVLEKKPGALERFLADRD